MKYEDQYGGKHKTQFGALKANLKNMYKGQKEKAHRAAIERFLLKDQVQGYESDPAMHYAEEYFDENLRLYVASTQKELVKYLRQDVKKIYLKNGPFIIPGNIGGVTYIGIDRPAVQFSGRTVKTNIDFEGVSFNGAEYLEDTDKLYHIFRDAPNLALKLLRETAEQGDAVAQTLLALCCQDGFGVAEGCTADSAQWAQKAAEQGYALAQMMYGFYLMDYACGVRKFYSDIFAEGIRWIQKAANQGYAKAQAFLGACYLNGAGAFLLEDVEDDAVDEINEIILELMKAVQWVQKAAEQNNKEAQTICGICFMEDGDALMNILGPGLIRAEARDEWAQKLSIERNNICAVDWFSKAAKQGQPEGQALLGCCFLEGMAGASDPAEGIDWLRKAADQGCSEARKLLEKYQTEAMDAETIAAWRNRISNNFLGEFLNCAIESWYR